MQITTLPHHFNPQSKVWVFQSNRAFTNAEKNEIHHTLQQFTASWKSHGATVTGYAAIFLNQFIVLLADETSTGVSGCSTDSAIKLMQQIGEQYQVQLFDRLMLAFMVDENVKLIHLHQLQTAFDNYTINKHTLYFNNTVLTKNEFDTKWLIPIGDSWLQNKLPIKK
jgi:hypothetical protein